MVFTSTVKMMFLTSYTWSKLEGSIFRSAVILSKPWVRVSISVMIRFAMMIPGVSQLEWLAKRLFCILLRRSRFSNFSKIIWKIIGVKLTLFSIEFISSIISPIKKEKLSWKIPFYFGWKVEKLCSRKTKMPIPSSSSKKEKSE